VSYPYEDLDDAQFERLVVQCSRKLFGIGVQSFATGIDGGRDARFDGVAERYPSTASPWSGITVIQAKHTNALNAHFSDSSFGSEAATSVISKELDRVRSLAASEELDNYLLVANRRLGANTSSDIANRIADHAEVSRSSVKLVGVEFLNDLLHVHQDLLGLARIDPIDGPLLASSYDLAEVILAISVELDVPPAANDSPVVDRTSVDKKNALNSMSAEFWDELARKYMVYSEPIQRFLANPANRESLARYEGAVDEFQLKIIAKYAGFKSFDDVFNHLVDTLRARDGILASKIRLTRAVLFYMYFHCDIGKV
jgi:hypothetical protein